MSYLLIQRLLLIREEFAAARAAVDYLEHSWPEVHREPAFGGLRLSQVRFTGAHLEATYLVRLFSAFEALLRDMLPHSSPLRPDGRSAYSLINRTASKWRITADVRDAAHQVREARNQAVHQQPILQEYPFVEALAALNRFLSWLPDAF